MSEDERREQTAAAQAEMDDWIAEVRSMAIDEGFKGSFGMFDLVFCGLAVLTAYKIGSGLTSDS